MCGIVGYIGGQQAAPLLLEGLTRLEHRGYDSAGIAVLGSGLKVVKRAGRVRDLADELPKRFAGKVGIGHTRWATHGPANDVNAHPHTSAGRVPSDLGYRIYVESLMRETASMIGLDPQMSALEISVTGSAHITGDREMLQVAFQNILMNAAQAMEGQGRIEIEIEMLVAFAQHVKESRRIVAHFLP